MFFQEPMFFGNLVKKNICNILYKSVFAKLRELLPILNFYLLPTKPLIKYQKLVLYVIFSKKYNVIPFVGLYYKLLLKLKYCKKCIS